MWLQGDVYMEVQQVFSSWVSQTVRIFPGLSFVEFEYTIGPIPVVEWVGYQVHVSVNSISIRHPYIFHEVCDYFKTDVAKDVYL